MMKSKLCSRCKLEKPITQYRERTDRKNSFMSFCNPCLKEYKSGRVEEAKEWFVNYKMSLSCEMCGYSKDTHERFVIQALNFHHPKDNKRFEVSRAVGKGYSISAIKEEIAKCIVLCNRCHVEIHNR